MFVGGHGAPNPKHKAELGLFRVWALLEQLDIDIIGDGTFPKSRTGFKYILSIIDHFTNWAVAVPMKYQTTETVAQAGLDHLINTFGVPMRIHSDRRLMLESDSSRPSAGFRLIQKAQTTAYRPQSYGTLERFNRILKDMLAKTAKHHPEE